MSAKFATYQIEESNKYGHVPALIAEYLRRWLKGSEHFAEGRLWVFRTLEEMAEDLGFSVSTIRRAIKKLIDCGLIIKKQLLKHKYRRNMYYSFCSEVTARTVQPERVEAAKMNTSYKKKSKKRKKLEINPEKMVQAIARLGKMTKELPTSADVTREVGSTEIEIAPGITRKVINDGLWPT